MKINYKVLWIEDEDVKPQIEGLTMKLSKYGFEFSETIKTTLTDDELDKLSDKLSKYNPYDMIFFDYDLGDSLKGDKIAKKLRKIIYTDMIFYSGKSGAELRKILFKERIDGVYIVSRTDFVEEVWLIIEDQIKRICDINNMRGVLLDEMSKIDLKLRKILKKKYKNLSEEKQKEQVEKIKKKFDERKKDFEKQKKKASKKIFLDQIDKPQKVNFNTIMSLLKSITKNDELLFGKDSQLKKKQELRNRFAHNMAKYDDENGTVSLAGDDKKTYDFKDFTKIRKELIELSKQIENIE